MGLEQCTKCKEYYNHCATYEYNLSQLTFNNPFFPKENESLVDKEKDFLNVNYNTNNNNVEIIDEEENKKEEMRIKNLKKQLLEKQKEKRKNKDNKINLNVNLNEIITDDKSKEKAINKKINSLLEDMCIFGSITKKEIIKAKKNNPENFIETSEALQSEKSDQNLFALGLLASNLENLGIETAIEKEINEDEQDAGITCLQFIFNGLAQKKKYDLHFELLEERNEKLLNDDNEFEKFKNDLRKKLSKDYHIPEDKIIVTFPQKGSFRVQVIFQSDEFDDLDIEYLKQKFQNDYEFNELTKLKEIYSDVIMEGCKLSKNQLDSTGNVSDGLEEGKYIGGKLYNSPKKGWTGIGLNVFNKYEDNEWVGCNNSDGEWCVAYHGIGRGLEIDQVKDTKGKIIKGTFKKGSNQVHKDCYDINHPGNIVGEGVYLTPNIDTASEYCGSSEINGKKYQIVLMVRVKPQAIRQCECHKEFWVVNGTTDEIRPYRILYRVCDE